MIAILLADGFEEIEALTPVDMLRRAGLDVKLIGMNGKIVCGSHGICVICDMTCDEVALDTVSTVILPGGMPGSINLDKAPFTDEILSAVNAKDGRIAAICAAPLVLGHRGLLAGKRATCYPGFEKELAGATVVDSGVVTDGNITTARGMGVALDFANELVSLICGKEKSEELSRGIMQPIPTKSQESLFPKRASLENEKIEHYINDKQFQDAVEIAIKSGKISTSLLQRKLSIGFGKAAEFIDTMEELGMISESNGQKPRDVLITQEEFESKFFKENN